MKVSSTVFQMQFGALLNRALTEPLTITRNGRDRLVLLSVEKYEHLNRRDGLSAMRPGTETAMPLAPSSPMLHFRRWSELSSGNDCSLPASPSMIALRRKIRLSRLQ